MLDYQTKGYTQYGADMGRRSDLPQDAEGPLTVRHVALDEGGYDPGGAYWGTPNDLYVVSDDDGRVRYLRAKSPDEAKAEFPNATWAPVTGEPTDADIDEMLDGYITCALWSTNDESDPSGGVPLDDNYSADDLADEARASMRADCATFARTNAATIVRCFGHGRCDWSLAGHDLWLTRNGHGCGFWDGDWPTADGDALSEAAHELGEVHLYVGDDGRIYAE
jgi:hypothetical protein